MGWVFLSWVGMIPIHVAVIGHRVNGGRESDEDDEDE